MARPRGDIHARVLRAAAERFLHDGVDGASLRQIAHEAGTSVGMVTYYFPTKDALFAAVVEDTYARVLEDITRALAPDAPFDDQVLRFYTRLAALDDEEFRVMRMVIREALVSSPRMPALFQRFAAGHIPVVFGAVARAAQQGALRDDVHPALVLLAMISTGMVPQVFLRVVAPLLPVDLGLPSPEHLARTMRDLLLRAVGAAREPGAAPRTARTDEAP